LYRDVPPGRPPPHAGPAVDRPLRCAPAGGATGHRAGAPRAGARARWP